MSRLNHFTARNWINCISLSRFSSSPFYFRESSIAELTWSFTPLFACCGTILLARCKRINPNSHGRSRLRRCRAYLAHSHKVDSVIRDAGRFLAGKLTNTSNAVILLRDCDTSLSRERFCFSIERAYNLPIVRWACSYLCRTRRILHSDF